MEEKRKNSIIEESDLSEIASFIINKNNFLMYHININIRLGKFFNKINIYYFRWKKY